MESFFSPSLHKQRHQFVIDFVRKNKPKKVVDLGCNDCSLLRKLKFHRDIELLAGVDIDQAVVKKKMHALAPIPTDYLQPGDSPLSIELFQGSVTRTDPRLRGFDLVTSIELIEHLHLADVERFSEVVFGYMSPLCVIVSTPNSEFNPLFPRMAGFRHYDHKFEWTRAEFQCWAQRACGTYGYEVEYTGVGQPPSGLQDSVGFCSQIGIFTRLRGLAGVLPRADEDETFSYTLLYRITYPSLCDNNILQRTLVNEVLYWAEMLGRRWLDNNAVEADEASTLCQEMDDEETGEMRERTDPCCRGLVLEERRHRDQELGAGGIGLEECYRQERCVCVPLARLWTCCPRVKALSGSLQQLRQFLLDDPLVRLTQDGTAVLVQDHHIQDQDEEDEEDDDPNVEVPKLTQAGLCVVEEEDWEADL